MKNKTLQQQVDELLCNAFIGVCFSVNRYETLAWHVEEDEERMQSIDELITELVDADNEDETNDLAKLKSLEAKGITEVVLIRGW